jgi:putative Mn2+ efflux pump MntP
MLRAFVTLLAMHPSALLALAVGLAMDATAVAASRGLAAPRIRLRDVLLVGGLFGGFQALMPLAGWVLGKRFGPYVEAWDHWIAFVLLAGIGGKMLWEAWQGDAAPPAVDRVFEVRVLLSLAVATSIDALAAGITLPMLGAPLLASILVIGLVTAALSILGLFAGRHFGAALGKRLDVAGGLVLIGLGVKILVEHLTAG